MSRVEHDFDEISFKEIILLVLRSWRWLLLAAVFASIGNWLQFIVKPPYSARASFTIEHGESNPFQMMTAKFSGLPGDSKASERLSPYVDFLESIRLREQIAKALVERGDIETIEALDTNSISISARLYELTKADFFKPEKRRPLDVERVKSLLRGKIRITTGKKSIAISVLSRDPEASTRIANLILDKAVQTVLDHDLKDLEEAASFIQGQITDIETKIKKIQNSISHLRNHFIKLSNSTTETDLAGAMARIRMELTAARTELTQTEKLLERLKNTSNQDFVTRNRIQLLTRERDYTASRVEALEKVRQDMVDTRNKLPNFEESIQNLLHEKEFQYTYSAELKKQLLQLEVQKISIQNRIRDVIRANKDTIYRRNFPVTKMFLAIFVACLITLITIRIIEHMAPPVITLKSDLEPYGFRYVGNVPNLFQKRIQNWLTGTSTHYFSAESGRDGHYPDIFNESDTVPRYDESQSHIFASIRSKVIHYMDYKEKSLKVLSIISPRQGDGKTFMTGRLATVFAQMEKKVLLIDADLMKRDLSQQMGYDSSPGLIQYLAGESDFHPLVSRHPDYDGLFLLPAGRNHQFKSDLLMNGKFSSLIEELKDNFDIILIDTPATLLAHDALVPMKTADFILVSITESRTKMDDIQKLSEELQIISNTEVGFVLNRSQLLSEYYYYSVDGKKAS